MSTYGRIVDNEIIDVQIVTDKEQITERYPAEQIKKWGGLDAFVLVPNGTLSGANSTTFENPKPPEAAPNNPNNPYFGKTPLFVKDFYALVGRVLPPQRYKRLRTDAAFLWIYDMLNQLGADGLKGLIDPDDKRGDFLEIVDYLTTTAAEDGQLLMEIQELDAIMGRWPEL